MHHMCSWHLVRGQHGSKPQACLSGLPQRHNHTSTRRTGQRQLLRCAESKPVCLSVCVRPARRLVFLCLCAPHCMHVQHTTHRLHASSNLSAVCRPGYGGASCIGCDVGSWSAGGVAGSPTPECTPCVAGTTTPGARSINATACSRKPCFSNRPRRRVRALPAAHVRFTMRSVRAFTLCMALRRPGH